MMMPYRCPRPNRAGRDSTDTWLLAFYERASSLPDSANTSKIFQSYIVVEKKERPRSEVAQKIPLTRHELGIEATMDFDLIVTGGIIVCVRMHRMQ
jgi:hypothetical protein